VDSEKEDGETNKKENSEKNNSEGKKNYITSLGV